MVVNLVTKENQTSRPMPTDTVVARLLKHEISYQTC